MNCTTSPSELLKDIANILENGDDFIISSHVSPDGDSIGSQLALYSLLIELDKKARVINTDPVPRIYRFLPFADRIEKPSQGQYEPDYLFVLDSGSLSRIGSQLASSISPKKATVYIDHHSECVPFGDINFISLEACATSEIIMDIIKLMGVAIGFDRAICLYTGIMTDTGGFRFSNTDSKCLRLAAELVDEGIDVSAIYSHVYENRTYGQVKLLGMVLGTLDIKFGGKLASMYVTRDMLRATGTAREDLNGMIDYARSIEGVEVALLFVEQEDGRTRVSLRSQTSVDVARIAGEFGGGGHARAAGFTIDINLNEAIEVAEKKVKEALSHGS